MMNVAIKRVYEEPSAEDGKRILVDRLWPRGLTKERAQVDLWLKDIAPSAELRAWFGHEVAKWDEFEKRYAEELAHKPDMVKTLRAELAGGRFTLVYAAKDERHNQAVVLQHYLER